MTSSKYIDIDGAKDIIISTEPYLSRQTVHLYGTQEAALYLDMSHQNLKYHLYNGHIQADAKVGHSLIFTQATLDDFDRRWPKSKNGIRQQAPAVFDVESI